MKRTLVFIIAFLWCAGAGFSQNKRTLAVLYFENNSLTKKEEMDPLRKGLADMLITELTKIDQFQVVERSRLQQMLEEMKLGQSGLLDSQSAVEVGKMLGAQNLFLGSFMHLLDGQMRIDVRIVNVETGVTIKAEEVTGKPKDLYKMVQNLVIKISDHLNVKLTKAETQRLEQGQNTSLSAALYYAKGLEYEDAGNTKQAIEMYTKALQENSGFTKAQERLNALKSK
jgi:TolB-like protein